MDLGRRLLGNTVDLIFLLITCQLLVNSQCLSLDFPFENEKIEEAESIGLNQTNCSDFKGTRPFIFALNESIAYYDPIRGNLKKDPRSLSVSNRSKLTEFNTILFRQFNCSYDQPVHWVFNLDPIIRFKMNVELDFSESLQGIPVQSVEKDTNFIRKGAPYIYTANFRLLYTLPDLQNEMLFSCEPVQINNPCERNFLQVYERNIHILPTNDPIDSLKSLSEALYASSVKKPVIDTGLFPSQEKCNSTLIIKVEDGNLINYRWEGNVKPKWNYYRTNETSYYENIFRLTDSNRKCVKQLNVNQPCKNCQTVGKITNYTLNGVIFHGKDYNGKDLVQKGHFSVPKGEREERKFYFDWQITNEIIRDEMMQIQVPTRIFANILFEVVCRVSIFHFSYGTVITDKAYPELEESKPLEYYSPYGYREVKHFLKFKEIGKRETVSCFAPLKKSEDWIVKFEEIIVEEAEAPSIEGRNNGDNDDSNSELHMFPAGFTGAVVADCANVTGNPLPSLKWILPKEIEETELKIELGEDYIRLLFPKWEDKYFGTYLCQASNIFGNSTKSITFQAERGERTSKFAITVSSSLGGSALFLAGLIGFLAWRIQKQRRDFEEQTLKAIEEFKNGIKSTEKMGLGNTNLDPNFNVMQLPYNEGFEVPGDKWNIEDKLLGSGQFGIVKMGQVLQKGDWVKVAVKTLKSSVEIDEFKSFLFELKIMAYLGQHKNIVSLIAACTEGINERNIFIGVEFLDNGCLVDYLRKYRGTFQNMVSNDGKLLNDTSFLNNSSQYANISSISTYDLYRWSYHVACGMEYLGMKKVLHGDLAARNVLLSARNVAKVGDFGLSRVLMNSENYTKRSKTALPWKWMAPESLRERVFSTNSDTWAYGILLYEIFTVGQAPYPGIGWSPDFVRQLENGLRMEKPAYCTNSVYKLMRSCWEQDPHARPPYIKIKRKLSKGLHRLSTVIKRSESIPSGTAESSIASASSKTRNTLLTSLTSRISSVVHHHHQNQETVVAMPPLAMDEMAMASYTNIPRGTNYYKNC